MIRLEQLLRRRPGLRQHNLAAKTDRCLSDRRRGRAARSASAKKGAATKIHNAFAADQERQLRADDEPQVTN